MAYANLHNKSTSAAGVQPGKRMGTGPWPAFFYSKGARVCSAALFILPSAFELTYIFLCAVLLTSWIVAGMYTLFFIKEVIVFIKKEFFHTQAIVNRPDVSTPGPL
jgi:hypothetical protein